MSLKDEHRDLARSNMFADLSNCSYSSLEEALYYSCRWSMSPQGEDFWCEIHDQILAEAYFDAPQQTDESCKASAMERMATQEDYEELENIAPPTEPNFGTEQALPTDAAERKTYPIYSGFINYFPHAIARVAHLSYKGNQQHHPDKPLHWDMDKSSDELDALMRHVIDGDWEQVAWRSLANLERKLTNKCTYEK